MRLRMRPKIRIVKHDESSSFVLDNTGPEDLEP
jgi:hypothetical protein